jgi:hypothetical protein
LSLEHNYDHYDTEHDAYNVEDEVPSFCIAYISYLSNN